MAIVSMKALLESGVHFGHRTNKWDPRMKPYIFTERNGIHIIDLQQTVKMLGTAYNVVRDCVAGGGTVLFVGTKRQAQETIAEEANRCGMPYVTERWMGGMLTNWSTMYQRMQQLSRLEAMRDTGELERLTKKEGLLIGREIERLKLRLSGARDMKRLPDMLFVVDVMREDAAVHEANLLDIPVVALVDTNCNPNDIDYIIPSNDDAIRAIKLLVAKMADAVLEGKAMRKDEEPVEELAAAPSAEERPRKAAQRPAVEEDLEDADLLGSATLAKMSRQEEGEGETSAEEKPVKKAAKDEESTEAAEKPAKKAAAKDEESAEAADTPAKKAAAKDEESAEATEKPAKKAAAKDEESAEEKPAKKAAAKDEQPATEEKKPAKKAAKEEAPAAEEKPAKKAAAKDDEPAAEKKPAKKAAKTTKAADESAE